MVLTTATETLMLFVDRLFLSRLSMLHMSAAMTGGLTAFVASVLIVGTVDYVNTLTAQSFGAGRHEDVNRTLFQGIWFGLLGWPLLLPSLFWIREFFGLFSHSPQLIDLESLYFSILVLGGPLTIVRSAFAAYFIGLGQTKLAFLANAVGTLANIPLNWVLIFGFGPIPALGMAGAALGTLGGSLVSILLLVLFWWRFTEAREWRSRLGSRLILPEARLLRSLIRFGLPAGFETFLNTLAFNLFLQMTHSFGEVAGAAVTITFNYDMLSFFPMFGLGIATSTLVGQYLGADRPQDARKSTFLSLRLALTYAAVIGLCFLTLSPYLVQAFVDPSDPNAAEVRSLAEVMIRMAALYTLFDATQIVFRGSLAGAGDTRWILVLSAILHWGLVLYTALGVSMRWPLLTIWAGFIGMVALLSVGTLMRYLSGKWRDIRVVEPAAEGSFPLAPVHHPQ